MAFPFMDRGREDKTKGIRQEYEILEYERRRMGLEKAVY